MKILKNTPDRLEIRFAPWVLGIVFIFAILLTSFGILRLMFVGLAFALMVRRGDLILDRPTNMMQIRHRTVFGRKTEYFDLDRLEQASTQSQYRSGGSGISYRIALILTGSHPKDIVNATPVYSGGAGARDAAGAVNTWHKPG